MCTVPTQPEASNQAADTPRIYVACLASYNSGTLHGRWIDADQGVDHIWEEVRAMLRESRYPNVRVDCPGCDGAGCENCGDVGTVPSAEEWAIHDYEYFGGMTIDESESFDDVAEVARLIEEHGPAYAAYADHQGGVDYAFESDFEDHYQGEWDTEEAYAENFIDDCYDLENMMGNLCSYFDYERFARDLFINDCYSVDNPKGGVFVFDSH